MHPKSFKGPVGTLLPQQRMFWRCPSEQKLKFVLMLFHSCVLWCQNQLWWQRRVPTERRLRHGQHGWERPHGDWGSQIRPQVHRPGWQHCLLWWVCFFCLFLGEKKNQADIRSSVEKRLQLVNLEIFDFSSYIWQHNGHMVIRTTRYFRWDFTRLHYWGVAIVFIDTADCFYLKWRTIGKIQAHSWVTQG